MRKINFASSLVICVLAFAECVPAQKRPNVLLIVADDLGYTDLGIYGSSFYETPVLDQLSKDGIRFTNGYASCPVCSPSRSSIQTGKYPVKTGVTDWIPGRFASVGTTATDRWKNLPTKNNLNLEEITIAEILKDNGYNTFFAGKWHLGETPEFWPENQGYDINMGGHSKGSPTRNAETGANGYFAPYGNPRITDGPKDEYLPDRLAAETIKFIESQTSKKPFLVCLPFYLVHNPQQAKEEQIAYFTEKRKTSAIDTTGEMNYTPAWATWATKGKYQERMIQGAPVYAAMVKSLDENIGKVIEKLKDREWYENTLIIFISDNGGLSTAEGSPTSNLPLRAGKGWLYEGGIRVPFILKMPGKSQQGITNQTPVSGIDILPTVLAITGFGEGLSQNVDGVDISQFIKNPDNSRPLFWHYTHYSNQGGNPGSAIRLGKYKLIHDFERGTAELYDLENDIGESNDLSKTHEHIADSLFKILDDWRIANNATMMTDPNPEWNAEEPIVR